MGDVSRTTNKDDLMNLQFVDLCIMKDLLNRLESGVEEI
jgi:hypothetical protein